MVFKTADGEGHSKNRDQSVKKQMLLLCFNSLFEDMPCSLIGLSMVLCDQRMGFHLAVGCTYEWFGVCCVCGASFEVLQPSQASKIQKPSSQQIILDSGFVKCYTMPATGTLEVLVGCGA